ncbi:MAG: CofH family radical SAM protein [Prevotellaceae bacterium]|jgi:cyclic dehypoxanthinyl futalosine synthase|nr:CofH family radical SAM protein [Prevotellaceae bacterium]
MDTNTIFSKALQLHPLTEDEAVHIYEHAPTDKLMAVASVIRQKHVPGKTVGWQIDRNVNYTNVCLSGCLFCNFHCKPHETDKHYTPAIEEYCEKIEALFAIGGNQLLLQGGLHPSFKLEFYESLFRELKKRYPTLKLHALGPPEVAHIARLEKMTYRETLERLIDAGLDSLPGAGAEILIDRVRKQVSPAKPDAQSWIEVMREAHRLRLATSATMLFGLIETLRERVQHLLKIRKLQSEKPKNATGFLNFICWPVQLKGTKLAKNYSLKPVTPIEYVRTVAISRIVLNNIKNIQASWLTVGRDTAQICLYAGANDLGSIMMEENVLAAVGIKERMDVKSMVHTIREAGFEPYLRNQHYQLVEQSVSARVCV